MLSKLQSGNIFADRVMVAASGSELMKADAPSTLIRALLPLALAVKKLFGAGASAGVDTFPDTDDRKKGFVFTNGFNIGGYRSVGS